MDKPVRIQRSRQHKQVSPNGLPIVYVGRPGKFGNPLRAGHWKEYGAKEVLEDYKKWLDRELSVRSFENVFGKPPTIEEIKKLKGKNLSCWCKIGEPCHADILLEIANQ